jgi:hypothetical protein
VNPKFVKKMWDDHMAMTVNNSHRLWSLAVIELWFDKHTHTGGFGTGNS